MEYRELAPSPALCRFVRCYWSLRAPAEPGTPVQRVLPDGCVEIIFNLAAPFVRHAGDSVERQPRALLVGPTTRQMTIAATGDVRLIGIRLTPGGARPFLTVAPADLRDAAPSLEDAAQRFAASIDQQLDDAPFGGEAPVLDAALTLLLARARRRADHRVQACVRATFAAAGAMRVDSLAALTGLGPRQLERRFRDDVGFGPKTLCRLARFERVVQALQPETRPRFAELALRAGYADQAHMARDFREFAGTTLSGYVRERHPMSDRFHTPLGSDM